MRAAIRQAIKEVVGPRKYELHIDPMRVQIIWFTDNLAAKDAPDLDNITKPFLDELEGIARASSAHPIPEAPLLRIRILQSTGC
jgi:hypothetical protein